MARQTYLDEKGREYRYDPEVDQTPRRKIMGYSGERQGGREAARERAAMRNTAARERTDAAMKRGFEGLPAPKPMVQNVAPVPRGPLPATIRRPAEPVQPNIRPGMTPAQQTVERIIPQSTYMSGLQDMLERARRGVR